MQAAGEVQPASQEDRAGLRGARGDRRLLWRLPKQSTCHFHNDDPRERYPHTAQDIILGAVPRCVLRSSPPLVAAVVPVAVSTPDYFVEKATDDLAAFPFGFFSLGCLDAPLVFIVSFQSSLSCKPICQHSSSDVRLRLCDPFHLRHLGPRTACPETSSEQ